MNFKTHKSLLFFALQTLSLRVCYYSIKGCPEPGQYGPDCSLSCPDSHCRQCHSETGTCQECKPGYQGDQCQEGNIVYL